MLLTFKTCGTVSIVNCVTVITAHLLYCIYLQISYFDTCYFDTWTQCNHRNCRITVQYVYIVKDGS